MNWLIFTITSLAVFRISLMFAKEKGPGRIFANLRKSTPARSSLREGVSCILCESVWWSAAATIALCCMDEVPWRYAPFYWLAVSAVAVIVNSQWTKGDL